MSFLEMPNAYAGDSSEEAEVTPTEEGNQAERFTAIRVRDVKTGRFVAGPSLVAKALPRSVTRIAEGATAGLIGGVIANQAPQNNRSWKTNRKKLKKLEEDMSVKLVKKSFVPGKGWVPASKLGKQGLKQAAGSRAVERQTGRRAEEEKYKFEEYRAWHDSMKEHAKEVKRGGPMMSGPRGSVMYGPGKSGMREGVDAYAFQLGGRRGERIMVVPKGTKEDVVRHEMEHLRPKRSSYRLFTNLSDAEKSMREEARADMFSRHPGRYYKGTAKDREAAGSGYTEAANSEDAARVQRWNGLIQGDERHVKMFMDEGLGAYRKTQDKIAASGKFKFRGASEFHGNQHVDEKGQKRFGRKLTYIAGGSAAGGGGYAAYKFRRKKSD